MATSIVLRALRRRDLSSSAYASVTAKQWAFSPLGQKCASIARTFSSKPAGHDVFGVGLGSPNTSVPIREGKNEKVIEITEGFRTTPSVVAFNLQGELLVGTPPKRQTVTNPTNILFGTKSLTGRHFAEPQMQNAMNMVPYKMVRDASTAVDSKLLDESESVGLPPAARSTPHVRPLSPHLTLYSPQRTSMLSIFHRISGAFLSTMVFSAVLGLKMGLLCLTYADFYLFCFQSTKFIPTFAGLCMIAMSYHVFYGVKKLLF